MANAKLPGIIKILYETQPTDIVFKLHDGEVRAHRWFLSARLDYFKAMFTSGMKEATTGVVEISDCDRSTYDGFLRYLYYGAWPPHLEDMEANQSISELAMRYDVPELFNRCVNALLRAMDRQKTVGTWLIKAQQVAELFERRCEALPENWAKTQKRRFRKRLRAKLRNKLHETTEMITEDDDEELPVDWRSRQYRDEWSDLENGTVFQHADYVLKSVLIACDQNDWIKDFLLIMVYHWIHYLKDYGSPMTEALRQVKESIGLFISFYGFFRTRSSNPDRYEEDEEEEIWGFD